ncbi:restriction endonuclease subunit S [Salegentibacter flavus]|uniref:Type I restriction enzyme, S subunit n=1 Tax=Salegentibacter flavus TaxID=287099 RepID=A0A1I4YHA8_9FLAO|nr:restriction endonuclease subunit S [Salegentibacter flavus]SFN37418.1 type I restriction enzyme, S subunit [Salegentibacter flavus]
MVSNKKYLKTSNFKTLKFWDYYTLNNKSKIYSDYPLVELSEVLTQRKESITIDDTKIYKRCRVKVRGQGIILRDEVLGKEIKTKKQYSCKEDDFLVAEIDAKVGGYGIVPKELTNAIVSGHYFLFEIDKIRLNPDFLSILTKCDGFSKQVKATGSTNYAAIRPYQVLEYLIPLPSLEEQNRIVESYNTKIKLAIQQEEKVQELEKKIKNYLFEVLGFEKLEEKQKQLLQIIRYSTLDRWDNSKAFALKSTYPIKRVKDILFDISTGTTPPTARKEYFDDGKINFYTPADLTDKMYLEESIRKVTRLAIDDRKARGFKQNTLLFVGIGSTIGKVGIIKNEYATSNQQITGLEIDSTIADIEFVYYYFNNFINITTKEKTQATIPIVNQNKILNIPIPLPPIETQKEIAEYISNLERKIQGFKSKAIQNNVLAMSEFEKEIFSTI